MSWYHRYTRVENLLRGLTGFILFPEVGLLASAF